MRGFFTTIIIFFAFALQNAAGQSSGIGDLLFGNQEADSSKLSDEEAIDFEEAIIKHHIDSQRITTLQEELEQMKVNEIVYLEELQKTRSFIASDSLKKAKHRQRIDSLRQVIQGSPVVVNGDTLFSVFSARGGVTAKNRALNTRNRIEELGDKKAQKQDSVFLMRFDDVTEIMSGEKVIYSVTKDDAIWHNTRIDSLALKYKVEIEKGVAALQKKNSLSDKLRRLGLFLIIFAAMCTMIWILNRAYRRVKGWVIKRITGRNKPISIKGYEFLPVRRQIQIGTFLLIAIRILLIILIIAIALPSLFSIFPQTKDLATLLWGYIFNPIKQILRVLVEFIPDLFMIIIIWIVARYIIRMFRFFSNEIEQEKLKIPGFYPDWAKPTFMIVKFLLYVFMIAMIYQYIPGSNSRAVQGITVFVGLLVSFGSSGVINNVISGLIITYMRPFKIGDRIQIDETVGNVIEKTALVTRIRTPKNEIITIPNSFVMSNKSTNFTLSAEDYGLIIHLAVGISYDVPQHRAFDLLIEAAKKTHGVMSDREPFVLELRFDKSVVVYQINAYVTDVNNFSQLMSDLHMNIHKVLVDAGIGMESFVFYARRDANAEMNGKWGRYKDADKDKLPKTHGTNLGGWSNHEPIQEDIHIDKDSGIIGISQPFIEPMSGQPEPTNEKDETKSAADDKWVGEDGFM